MDGKQVDLAFGHSILPTDKGGVRDFFDALVTLGLLRRRRCSRDAQPAAIPKGRDDFTTGVSWSYSCRSKIRDWRAGLFLGEKLIKYSSIVY